MPNDINIITRAQSSILTGSLQSAVILRSNNLLFSKYENIIIVSILKKGEALPKEDIKVLEKIYKKSGKLLYKYSNLSNLKEGLFIIITPYKNILPIVEKDWPAFFMNCEEGHKLKIKIKELYGNYTASNN